MRRILIVGATILIVLLLVAQLFLPGYLEGRVSDRLTKNGGKADVTLDAVPALTLLAGSGSEAKVRGHGLALDLTAGGDKPLDQLDGFGKVDVDVTSSTAGPFRVDELVLRRGSRDQPYTASVKASVTGRDLAAYAGGSLAGPLGSLFGGLAAGAAPFSDARIPVDAGATITSDGGRPVVTSADGTIAGLPAGPFLQALAVAVGGRF
jgi:hypothetical protein